MQRKWAFHARVRGSFPDLGGLKEKKKFFPYPLVKLSIVGSLRDQEVACSASDLQGLYFESCVWRAVSFNSSHHPQEVILVQFGLYVQKDGLKPDLFCFISNGALGQGRIKWEKLYYSNWLAYPPANEFIVNLIMLKGLAQAKIIKKSVILFWLLNMTI